MQQLWFTLLYQPLVNALIFFYQIFGGNLGWAIIGLTVVVRLLVVPLMKPQLEASKKMQLLAPELEKLKKKFKDDKQKLLQAQMELYKQAGVNPGAGCLPQIIQFLILIALFQAFSQVLKPDGATVIQKLNEILYPSMQLPTSVHLNLNYFWLNLAKPDLLTIPSLPALPGIFLLLSAIAQFLSAKMMMPVAPQTVKVEKKDESSTQEDFSSAMQMQMTYMFPLMTLLIGYNFPSGLVLYWLVFSVVSMGQQYLTSGLGGLEPYLKKIKS
jgi:YidC/Oxa1 family membrane protein insertase